MESLSARIAKQGTLVRTLKEAKNNTLSDEAELTTAINELLSLKNELKEYEAKQKAIQDEIQEIRDNVEGICLRKFFYVPSFEIYGGFKGLYDFGPTGCAVKENIISQWRNHFILTEHMLEVSCSMVTPEIVLKTSGHVERFNDFMVEDLKTKELYRADKLLEEFIDHKLNTDGINMSKEEKDKLLQIYSNADAYNADELHEILTELDVHPLSNPENPISKPYPFNLMFKTSIGPSGKLTGYLRPETAQGIFVNFKRLLDYNKGKTPFAAAQIGYSFRNEISPRSGLLRVREFPMAEIEHFVHPKHKAHEKFHLVKDIVLGLLSAKNQDGHDQIDYITIGQAVEQHIVNNETLGYFLARTFLFLLKIGIDNKKIRFRQHKANEMAHYANDCWDAEIYTTYGWIECVGHADRGAYDLTMHSKETQKSLLATINYKVPKEIEIPQVKLNMKLLGMTFKKKSKMISNYLKNAMKIEEYHVMCQKFNENQSYIQQVDEDTFELTSEMFITLKTKKTVLGETFLPNVIEPSFGLGRILYATIEHAYKKRIKEDSVEHYLALQPIIAPFKVCICTLSAKSELKPFITLISNDCINLNLAYDVDNTNGSIGRKYARADEIGIPLAICIDFDTINDQKVTIRERDSTKQIRVAIDQVADIIYRYTYGKVTFIQLLDTYGEFN